MPNSERRKIMAVVWRKSSFSGGNGGTDCVEIALPPESAALRDSKNRGPMLVVPRAGWTSLLARVSCPDGSSDS
jgi:uncharacterized protein DUF397